MHTRIRILYKKITQIQYIVKPHTVMHTKIRILYKKSHNTVHFSNLIMHTRIRINCIKITTIRYIVKPYNSHQDTHTLYKKTHNTVYLPKKTVLIRQTIQYISGSKDFKVKKRM